MSTPRRGRTALDPDSLRPRGRHLRAARRRRRRHGAAAALAGVVLLAALAGVAGTAGVLAYGSSCDLDSLQPTRIGQNTFVYAADGSRLGSIPAEKNREPVVAGDMSRWVRRATIAIEDRRFFEHSGVDFEGIARATVKNIEAGGIVEGGSTITQQLVRNLYISREQTVQRKVKEACLATKLDRAWTKERILTTYLNQVYYGNHAYGIEAASQTYYSKPAGELTLSEAALLAGLTQAPSSYNPFTSPARALARRQEVLRAMLDTRVITSGRYERASATGLRLRPGRLYSDIREPYFFGYVRDKLIEVYGAETVRSGGLSVYTTIVPRYQRLAEKAIRDTLNQPNDPASALISISPRTGAIRAMAAVVPNRPGNQFNLLSQARRQPGSTFKTFVLTAAVEMGVNPDSTYYVSAPFTYKVHPAGNCDDGSWWCVQTYANDYYGWSSIRSATIRSDNAVYAQLTLDVTPGEGRRGGADGWVSSRSSTSRGAYVPAIGLGSIAVSPLDLASATRRSPQAASTRSRWRSVGWSSPTGPWTRRRVGAMPKRRRVISEGTAAIVTRILEQNVQYGHGHACSVRTSGRREDGNHEEQRRRVVRGLHARSRDDRLDRVHASEIPLENVHGIAVTRRELPCGDLAALHGARARGQRAGRRSLSPSVLAGVEAVHPRRVRARRTTRAPPRRRTTEETETTPASAPPAAPARGSAG